MQNSSALVSPFWLNQHIDDANLVLFMSTMNVITTGEPEAAPSGYIPHAQLFDFEHQVCDKTSSLPHTMPSPEVFQQEVRKLGVNNDSVVVIYDNQGVFSAPRVWWMFKCMGHKHVYVLNGGFPAWQKNGFTSDACLTNTTLLGDFISNYRADLIVGSEQVLAALSATDKKVIDARSSERFFGKVEEPRAHLRSGHMPNACNLPFNHCVDKGKLINDSVIRKKFEALKISKNQTLIFSCGSGVTACVLALAAHEAGYEKLSVYDGSWSEWGADNGLPVVTD
ncbi:sulfurtransferase [Paraglaciecola sp. 20A4]|uniref:sulfurtransferase n=1 Tax=Paraglaciecola sp. 20A4 TaxID=2687288 RepID=UPI00140E3FFD|nr:sulfurtransferase [Paraglaciecola sp. 20A4]